MTSQMQREMIAQGRDESRLDESLQLGYPTASPPISGPTVTQYFRQKHARGDVGTFFPLHIVEAPPWEQAR
jgi:hypothetical protein